MLLIVYQSIRVRAGYKNSFQEANLLKYDQSSGRATKANDKQIKNIVEKNMLIIFRDIAERLKASHITIDIHIKVLRLTVLEFKELYPTQRMSISKF